jgi:hypothetical protein
MIANRTLAEADRPSTVMKALDLRLSFIATDHSDDLLRILLQVSRVRLLTLRIQRRH